MPDRRWKRQERAVARTLNGQRVGPTGRNSADVVSERYGIECKTRKALPDWLTGALDQAQRNCPPDKTPLLVLCWCPGQGRRIQRYAVLDLETFQEMPRNGRKAKCQGTRKDGTPCQANALPSGYCWGHDPEMEQQRAEARKKGGQGKSTVARISKRMSPRLVKLCDLIEQALTEVHDGTITPAQASAMASLASALIKAVTAGELEARVQKLEERIPTDAEGRRIA